VARKTCLAIREMADRQGKRCAFYADIADLHGGFFLDLGLSDPSRSRGSAGRLGIGFTLDGSNRKLYARTQPFEPTLCVSSCSCGRHCHQCGVATRFSRLHGSESKQGGREGFSLGAFEENYMHKFRRGRSCAVKAGRDCRFHFNLFKGSFNLHELSFDSYAGPPPPKKFGPPGGGAAPDVAMDALLAELMLWGSARLSMFSLGCRSLFGHRKTASWHPSGTALAARLRARRTFLYNFEGLRGL